jgi:hypothetical protein
MRNPRFAQKPSAYKEGESRLCSWCAVLGLNPHQFEGFVACFSLLLLLWFSLRGFGLRASVALFSLLLPVVLLRSWVASGLRSSFFGADLSSF